MEYTPLDSVPYYTDCEPLITGLGYTLVELKVIHKQSQYQIRAVITHKDQIAQAIGITDCAKVHRLLLPRFEAMLQSQDVYMEVTSPGTERQIKNAAEFMLFINRQVRVWDIDSSDWIYGRVVQCDQTRLVLEILDTMRTIPLTKIAKAKLLNA